MNPATRMSAALVGSLLLWSTSMAAYLRGEQDVVAAGVRYVMAFLLSLAAVNVVARIAAGYLDGDGSTGDAVGSSRAGEETGPVPARRREDQGRSGGDEETEAA